MAILIAVLLGFVQGVTEFLPVSSSGHVLIASRLLQSPSSFEFDVLVSFGTLFAVIIHYRRRFAEIILDIFSRRDFRLALKLLVASIPAALVGFLLQDFISLYLHSTGVAIFMLILIGALMIWSADWRPSSQLPVNRDLHKITFTQAFLIGAAQCVALVSGSSRSGVTMLAALRQGFTTKVAAEWSFLMSVPIILGASLRVLVSEEGLAFISMHTEVFVIANIVSFVSGMLAIRILLKILERWGLRLFGWYRIVLAAVLILLLSVKLL